jgi:hypothetical protein
MGGKAQGTAAGSKKLTDLVKSTGEFTIGSTMEAVFNHYTPI